jgi:hypothetical protein
VVTVPSQQNEGRAIEQAANGFAVDLLPLEAKLAKERQRGGQGGVLLVTEPSQGTTRTPK